MRILVRHNRYVINRTKPCQVAWWATELAVSEGSLLNAIAMVGHQAREVEFYLRVGKPRRRPESHSVDFVSTTRVAAHPREKVTAPDPWPRARLDDCRKERP